MSTSISEDFRKVWLAGIGALAVTGEKAEELIEKLIKKGELTARQGKALNEELKHNVREKVKDTVAQSRICVEGIIDNLDKMSKEDIAAIKAKLASLEERDDEK
jgi:Uncharacterized conserved protein